MWITETRAVRGAKAVKAEAMWAEHVGVRLTEHLHQMLPETRFSMADNVPTTAFVILILLFLANYAKKLPQRREGLNLSAPYSPPPLLFSIDFLHNRHFN